MAGEKKRGLYQKYEVKKLSNPTKKLDCIVLEFDDPIARDGIRAFARSARIEGYEKLASDLFRKLAEYSTDITKTYSQKLEEQ